MVSGDPWTIANHFLDSFMDTSKTLALSDRSRHLLSELKACPYVREDLDAIRERSRSWFWPLVPQNYFHAWLVDEITILTLRIDHCQRISRRARDRETIRAELFWDDDRRLAAERLGATLATDPIGVVAKLSQSAHGCDWLVDRWSRLLQVLEANKTWTSEQHELAVNLLAQPREFRGIDTTDPAELAELARERVAAWTERGKVLSEVSAADRALAEADLDASVDTQLVEVRRHERQLQRRLAWCAYQLQYRPKERQPHPNLREYFDPNPDVPPAPVAETPQTTEPATIAPDAEAVESDPETPERAEARARRTAFREIMARQIANRDVRAADRDGIRSDLAEPD
jgi:hypothetical protein